MWGRYYLHFVSVETGSTRLGCPKPHCTLKNRVQTYVHMANFKNCTLLCFYFLIRRNATSVIVSAV